MNRRKFLETFDVAAGAAILSGVNSTVKDEPAKKAKSVMARFSKEFWNIISVSPCPTMHIISG